jgi:cobalt-zinc-cadmium resistance protein CzcA
MAAWLIRTALAQRVLVAALALALALAGAIAWRDLPIDAFPDVSSTQVKVVFKAPGMTPEEVEARIVVPIELELLGIPRKRMLRSTSKYAIADVTLDFEEGTDLYWARQQVAERLADVARELPPGASGGLAPVTTPLGEMVMFTVDGPLSLAERRGLLDWVIRPALRTVPGVADVNALGGEVRALEVVPDPAALATRGLDVARLLQALRDNSLNDGAGRLSAGDESILVRTEGAIAGLDDLRAIVVDGRGGRAVRLGDVAQVRAGELTRYGAVTTDGRDETVQGLVLGLRGADAGRLVEAVHARLREIEPMLPEGTTLDVFYDRGQLVGRAVGTVTRALAEAIVLVVVLLILFLGDVRAALVVAVTLPLSALATFVAMRQAGMSANLMSLGGLAIAIGMLVDASVVVVENVVAHDGGGFASPLERVSSAAQEVAVPVVSGVAIIILVFLPLLTLQGLEGKLFAPVALTIVFALAASMVLSLTLVPVLASWLLRGGAHRDPWLPRQAARLYARALEASLAHGRAVVATAVIALVATGFVYGRLGKTFMPTMDEGDVIMQLEKLPSIGLESSLALDLRLQRAVLERVPEVRRIVARTGSDELGLDPMGLNQTDTFLVLKPPAEWRDPDKARLVDALREVAVDFPGMVVSFTQPIDMRVSEMLTGTRGDVAVKLYGPELAVLARLAEGTAATLRAVPGAEDVLTVRNEGVQYLRVVVDRLAAGRHGFDAATLSAALRQQLEGQVVGIVREADRRTPLLVRGDASLRGSPSRFAALTLTAPDGTPVPLASLARLERVDGPVKVDRENARRLALVQANVRGRDLVGFVDDAKRAVARDVPLPPGYTIAWGGQFENQQRAAARLATMIPIALGGILALLYATFGSLRQAVLVFVNIPFAMVGGVLALGASGEYLSVPASVGFIALLGIAVLNGVVMVSTFNQLSARGLPIERVVREGAQRRLRPVLMTASIAAFGLVPLLFATGPGSEIQRPLAIVVIGGLVSATALTLLILPLLYRRFGAPRGGAPATAPATAPAAAVLAVALAIGVAALAGAPAPARAADPPPRGAPASGATHPSHPTGEVALDAAGDLPDAALVARVLASQPAVEAALLDVDTERAQRARLVAGPYEPAVRAGGQARRVDDPAARYGEWTVALERTLRSPFKADLDRSIGEAGVRQAGAAVGEAKHEAARTLLQDWFAWLRETALAREWAAQAALADAQRDVVARRVRAGDASRLELGQAEAAFAQAGAQQAAAQGRARAAEAELARRHAIVPPSAPAIVPPPPVEGDADAWRAQVLAASHELAVVREASARAVALARRVDAERRPDPTVGVHVGSERGGGERILGLAVAVPIAGAARAAASDAAVAQAGAAARREAAVRRRIEAEVDALRARVEGGRDAWLRLDDAAGRLELAAAGSARAYTLGQGTLGEVLAARRIASEARISAAQALADAAAARYRLLLDAHALWDLDSE